MFDHVALGIVLPGPITWQERRQQRLINRYRALWRRWTGYSTSPQYSAGDFLDPDFDDPAIFTLAEPEMPKPPGAEQ